MFQNQSNNIQNNQINNMPNNQPIAKPTVQTEFNNTNTSNNQPVKLKRFKYKVKEADGKIIESFFDAENKVDVESFLLNKGYQIIEITEDKLSASLGLIGASTSKKMSSKDLNFFLTQLSTYVKSGIPLLDSMEILSRQSKKKNIKQRKITVLRC